MESKQPDEPQEPQKKQSKRFLAVYIIGLFSVALVLILLSYLTQVRAGKQLEALNSQLNAQTSAVQGAEQRMQNLQATLEEQNRKLQEQKAQLAALAAIFQGEGEMADQAKLLQERYIALDALQQVRRKLEAGDQEGARTLLAKMTASYGESRLTSPNGADSVLLGANSEEFIAIRAKLAAEAE